MNQFTDFDATDAKFGGSKLPSEVMSLAMRAKSTLLKWLDHRAQKLTARLEDKASLTIANGDESPSAASVLEEAEHCAVGGNYDEAVPRYRAFLRQEPGNPHALLGLAVTLYHLGRFKEAAEWAQRAIEARPDSADAHSCLGYVLRALGRFAQSEISICRALTIDPTNIAFQANLGQTLLSLGRSGEAADYFKRVLQIVPADIEATLGLAEVARLEGRFNDAETILKRALELNPAMPRAWARLASLRKMTPEDGKWLEHVQGLLESNIGTVQKVDMLFAIGKYWDDVGDYALAFENFRAANERLKTSAKPYNKVARTRFVDDMIRVYTQEALAGARKTGSDSTRPVLVVGMPRSGTSLVEQIIASHPAAAAAGELGFWTEVLLANVTAIRQGVLPEATRRQLAQAYLRVLNEHSLEALRVIDKAPVNSEYLGLIHSVVPHARIIYVRRDPIDTCLSCYFQYFSAALSYTMDLEDLAHYCREHYRQFAHWRAVLPPSAILEVPYEGLVADQESWTRRILQFIDLEWNEQCLRFHETKRVVVTASNWQVRQKMYSTSVQRWRHYEPYIGPLLALRDLW